MDDIEIGHKKKTFLIQLLFLTLLGVVAIIDIALTLRQISFLQDTISNPGPGGGWAFLIFTPIVVILVLSVFMLLAGFIVLLVFSLINYFKNLRGHLEIPHSLRIVVLAAFALLTCALVGYTIVLLQQILPG